MEESHGVPDAALEQKVSNAYRENLPLVVSEEEALTHARARPNEPLPLLLTFGDGDRDNPRCWAKLRKWYITLFVSMLNVLTYVLFSDLSRLWTDGDSDAGVPGVFRPEPLPSPRNSVSRPKSPRCVCRYMSWDMQSVRCCWRRCPNTSAVSPSTSCPGSCCVSSRCPSPWPRTSAPCLSVGSWLVLQVVRL